MPSDVCRGYTKVQTGYLTSLNKINGTNFDISYPCTFVNYLTRVYNQMFYFKNLMSFKISHLEYLHLDKLQQTTTEDNFVDITICGLHFTDAMLCF